LALSTRRTRAQIEERLMAASMAVMGVAILFIELPINASAVVWVAFGWSFAMTVPGVAAIGTRIGRNLK
ncbi:MAG: hypothetical protein M3O82_09595, partial [Verrucomicrobiota bacterium]|nr:hypothetical protein [Verrucomicrobiota bacterium]